MVNKLVDGFYRKMQRWLLKNNIILNEKQRAWLEALNKLGKKKGIVALETGRIRNPSWKESDGNSTYFLTGMKKISKLISVDNDSENFSGFTGSMEYCKKYLRKTQLSKVDFRNGDSVKEIKKMPASTNIDFVLLDSANDPELIFQAGKREIN